MCLLIVFVCVCVYSCRVGRRTQETDKEEGAWGTASPRKLGCGRNPSSGLLGQRRETRETPAHGGLSYQHTCLALNFWPWQQNIHTLLTPELLYLPLVSPPSFYFSFHLSKNSVQKVHSNVVVFVCTISISKPLDGSEWKHWWVIIGWTSIRAAVAERFE